METSPVLRALTASLLQKLPERAVSDGGDETHSMRAGLKESRGEIQCYNLLPSSKRTVHPLTVASPSSRLHSQLPCHVARTKNASETRSGTVASPRATFDHIRLRDARLDIADDTRRYVNDTRVIRTATLLIANRASCVPAHSLLVGKLDRT